ncbi:MAG: hypothetical protein WBA76_14245, partial [Phormidesmis sp.]
NGTVESAKDAREQSEDVVRDARNQAGEEAIFTNSDFFGDEYDSGEQTAYQSEPERTNTQPSEEVEL